MSDRRKIPHPAATNGESAPLTLFPGIRYALGELATRTTAAGSGGCGPTDDRRSSEAMKPS